MTLEQNHVYAAGPAVGPGQRLRVLQTGSTGISVVRTDAEDSEPYPINQANVMAMRWEPTEDPWEELRATHDDDIAPLNLARRDRAAKSIQHLRDLAREDAPAGCQPHLRLLDTNHRFRLIKAAAKQLNAPKNTLRRWLIKWWVRGMCKNALLPDVIAMSGAGTIRVVPSEACDSDGNPVDPNLYKKPGRPSGNGTRMGTKMTDPVRASIETLGRKIYFDHPLNSVPNTYTLWKAHEKAIAPHRYPSPQIFYTVLVKDAAVKAEIKRRGLVGRKPRGGAAESDTMHARVPGPGFCFQGDATPLSRIKVRGKSASLYFASDTFSSGIAGHYAYPGKPRADAHSRCLAHAATDKPSYCSQYGIHITKEQWPMAVVPEAWVSDRGELIGPIADYMVSSFDITLHNTPAYSPQLKADVEAAFGAMLRDLISKLDDYVTPRPGRLFGETIELTMHELNVLIILFILAYNSRKLPQVPNPSQMARMVPMSPLGLWNKEMDRLNGEGCKFSRHELLLVTTKREEAKLDEAGILFEGLTYNCPESGVSALQSDLGGRRKTVKIHYDEDATDRIFIQRKELTRLGVATVGPRHEFIECPLDKRDADWAGYTFPSFREAYKQHTEATQSLYDYADERKAALAQGIADQNAGKTAVPEISTPGNDLGGQIATGQVTATASAPTSPPDLVTPPPTPQKSAHENVAPPVLVRIPAGLRRAREQRTNNSQ